MNLERNQFSAIPSTITNLTKLFFLNISNNPISGDLPNELWRLRGLTVISMAHCGVTGSLAGIGELSLLNEVDASHNDLTGGIPPNELLQLTRLHSLHLFGDARLIRQVWDFTGLDNFKYLCMDRAVLVNSTLCGAFFPCELHGESEESRPNLADKALDELNFYRKLLQMDPLTTLDEPSSDLAIVKPATYPGSITRSAAFETMPPEILDHIAQFVDGESILPLCHSLPYYKYISAAMFDFKIRFEDEMYKPSKLWPDMHFPGTYSDITAFPIQHMHAAGVYARIISKHGGIVHVPCSKNVVNYMGALPDVVSVHPGEGASSSGWVELLRGLADAKIRIRTCAVEVDSSHGLFWGSKIGFSLKRLSIQSLVWRDEVCLPFEVQQALPAISGLSFLEMYEPNDINENILSRCSDLKEISFIGLPGLQHSADQVEAILRRIRGSPVQKVWCDMISPKGDRFDSEALDAITSGFLKRGWHRETHGDEKVCFVRGEEVMSDESDTENDESDVEYDESDVEYDESDSDY
ncbi:hypothetical protein HDU77_000821, partial [Chytriomyces hyalinus]